MRIKKQQQKLAVISNSWCWAHLRFESKKVVGELIVIYKKLQNQGNEKRSCFDI